jgi:hypothetical protein
VAKTERRNWQMGGTQVHSGLRCAGWLTCLLALCAAMLPCSSAPASAPAAHAMAMPHEECGDCCKRVSAAPSVCCSMHEEQGQTVSRTGDLATPSTSLERWHLISLVDVAAPQRTSANMVGARPPLLAVLRI